MLKKQHRSKKEKCNGNRKKTGKVNGNAEKLTQANTVLLQIIVY